MTDSGMEFPPPPPPLTLQSPYYNPGYFPHDNNVAFELLALDASYTQPSASSRPPTPLNITEPLQRNYEHLQRPSSHRASPQLSAPHTPRRSLSPCLSRSRSPPQPSSVIPGDDDNPEVTAILQAAAGAIADNDEWDTDDGTSDEEMPIMRPPRTMMPTGSSFSVGFSPSDHEGHYNPHNF